MLISLIKHIIIFFINKNLTLMNRTTPNVYQRPYASSQAGSGPSLSHNFARDNIECKIFYILEPLYQDD
jgi:hypothetical protein